MVPRIIMEGKRREKAKKEHTHDLASVPALYSKFDFPDLTLHTLNAWQR